MVMALMATLYLADCDDGHDDFGDGADGDDKLLVMAIMVTMTFLLR